MSSEPVFVAIGIACVVAVLLFIVFIIYCVKKQQDKEESRRMRQRRAREETHRRHLMRSNIVHPPPYDANSDDFFTANRRQIPMTPPPEYKEIATPMPRNRDAFGTSFHGENGRQTNIQTISRNFDTATTGTAGNSFFIKESSLSGGRHHNSNSHYRNTQQTSANTDSTRHFNNNTFLVQSHSDISTESFGALSNSAHNNSGNSKSNARTNESSSTAKRGLNVSDLFRVHNNDRRSLDNAQNFTNRSEDSYFASANQRDNIRSVQTTTNRDEDIFFASANQRGGLRKVQNHTNQQLNDHSLSENRGFISDRTHNSIGYVLPTSYVGEHTSRTYGTNFESRITHPVPGRSSTSGFQPGRNSQLQSSNLAGNYRGWNSSFEDLSVI